MSSGVRLSWGGFDKALGKAAKKLADKHLLMESVGEALVAGTLKRFQDEKDPQGNSWRPSARALAGGKTLTDTARLRNSIDSAVAGDTVFVGSNVVYSRIHQMGGMAGKGRKVKIPARPYLGVSKEDWKEVEDTIKDFLVGAFK
jgi:phage virion morphogenesis protein